MFDGRKIRDEILGELKNKISRMNRKPTMAVFLVGDDPVSATYVALKEKIAKEIGITFLLYRYKSEAKQDEVLQKIKLLNNQAEVDGIMMQIPLPQGWDRDLLVKTISPKKDIDGLRYCLGLESDFIPPVVLAIDSAIRESGVDLGNSTVLLVGRGFLVGEPTFRYICNRTKKIIIATSKMKDLAAATSKADVIISAAGSAGIITPGMIREGVVLIDAGTSEMGGELKGDIDPESYPKAAFYTPVPGGIGPATVAYLMNNLVDAIRNI